MEEILLALVPIAAILSGAAVLIFRPLSKRLGDILELQQRDKQARRLEEGEHDRLRDLMAALETRVEALEQRVDFTESLVEGGGRRSLGPPGDTLPPGEERRSPIRPTPGAGEE